MNFTVRAFAAIYWPIPLCCAMTAFFVYFPITDTDIFWHLSAGREMVAHGGFLYTDPFAYTLDAPRWIDLHWLFQLLVYSLFSIGGYKALLLFKLAAAGSAAGLLCLTHRSRLAVFFSAFLAALLFYQVRYLLCVRPVLVTIVCMAAYVFLFENTGEGRKKAALWLCVPLQIIWTNSQGLYLIGLFIVGAYWLDGTVRFFARRSGKPFTETAVLLACSLSCLVNPYGAAGLLLPFELFARITPGAANIYSTNISENVPLFSLTGFEASYRTTVLVTAAVALSLFALNRKKIRVAHLVLFFGFLSLAVGAVRNVLLYAVAVVPIIAWNAANLDVWKRLGILPLRRRRHLQYAACAAAVFALARPVMLHAAVMSAFPPRRLLSPFRFPETAAAYLERQPVPGRMFNEIRDGGYLIWRFYPGKKVFIDGRLIIRSPAFFAEFLTLTDHPELFDGVAEKFDVTHAILPWAVFNRYQALIKHLYFSESWHLEFTDGATTLFVRNDMREGRRLDLSSTAAVDSVTGAIETRWKDAPAVRREALGYFAELLAGLGLRESAESVRSRM